MRIFYYKVKLLSKIGFCVSILVLINKLHILVNSLPAQTMGLRLIK
jgi:hypothetical protein